MLRALFSTYPGGRQGFALLLLRLAPGVTLLIQSVACLADPAKPELWRGVAALIGGALLTLGLLTPLAATWIATSSGVFALVHLPCCGASLFDALLTAVLAGSLLAAIFLIGPGAYSVDARLFGRREIVIQPHPSGRR